MGFSNSCCRVQFGWFVSVITLSVLCVFGGKGEILNSSRPPGGVDSLGFWEYKECGNYLAVAKILEDGRVEAWGDPAKGGGVAHTFIEQAGRVLHVPLPSCSNYQHRYVTFYNEAHVPVRAVALCPMEDTFAVRTEDGRVYSLGWEGYSPPVKEGPIEQKLPPGEYAVELCSNSEDVMHSIFMAKQGARWSGGSLPLPGKGPRQDYPHLLVITASQRVFLIAPGDLHEIGMSQDNFPILAISPEKGLRTKEYSRQVSCFHPVIETYFKVSLATGETLLLNTTEELQGKIWPSASKWRFWGTAPVIAKGGEGSGVFCDDFIFSRDRKGNPISYDIELK
jgi:hypothetical protein